MTFEEWCDEWLPIIGKFANAKIHRGPIPPGVATRDVKTQFGIVRIGVRRVGGTNKIRTCDPLG